MIGWKTCAIVGACALAAVPATAGPAKGNAERVLAAARPAVSPAMSLAPAMLGTTALPIRAERFVVELARARQDNRFHPAIQRLIAPARGLAALDKLDFVQKAVNRRVRWMSDTTLWGRHDYWATAAETLDKGAGDMEDRAIVKMQALRAMGFAPSDLFLTLARDRVGGPMTVLTARIGDRYYVLDDSGSTPFDSERRRIEFAPLMSFGLAGAWMHVARAVLPRTSMAAARQ
ncbi:MAG: transglutaminase-like cysteine peptidase [Sphingomicrobium sp.]